jgi:hypothetical protein
MLEWTTGYDDHDNTVHEAQGPYQDQDGTTYYFRINPILVDNTIKFTTGSTGDAQGTDDELIPFLKQETFDTLGQAKSECQQKDAEIRAALAASSDVA